MAATIGGSAADPIFNAAAGIDNNLTITQSAAGDTVTFSDTGDAVTVDPVDNACVRDVPATGDVTCTVATTIGSITVNLGDSTVNADPALNGSDNESAVSVTSPMTVNGGPGVDILSGGDGADTLNGDAGDDGLTGGAGADHLNGGAGADTIDGGDGTDVLHGDAGDDTLILSAGADDINGDANDNPADFAAGTLGDVISDAGTADLRITLDGVADDGVVSQNANVHGDVETVLSGDGNDTITGSASANILVGGGGNDTINSRDSVADTISCGAGADIANHDALDTFPAVFAGDCETRNVPAVDPGPGPGPGPGPVVTPGPTTPAATAPAATAPAATAPAATAPAATTPAPNTPSSTPGLPAAKSLSLKLAPSRDRSRPYTFTITGKLGLPSGVTATKGCSGTVTLTGKRGTKTAFTKTASLKKDCTYSVKVTVKGKGKLKISAKFSGNSVMAAKSSATLSARAG